MQPYVNSEQCWVPTLVTLLPPLLSCLLHHDRRVLRFYALSKLPEYPHGKHGNKKYVICFYLADNSIEVRDVRDTCDAKGAGSFPKFLKRQNLPKSRTGCADAFPSMTAAEKQNYFSPPDFMIGKTVTILNKEFFIYDLDDFTRRFYKYIFTFSLLNISFTF